MTVVVLFAVAHGDMRNVRGVPDIPFFADVWYELLTRLPFATLARGSSSELSESLRSLLLLALRGPMVMAHSDRLNARTCSDVPNDARGATSPVDCRAVCFVRAMATTERERRGWRTK